MCMLLCLCVRSRISGPRQMMWDNLVLFLPMYNADETTQVHTLTKRESLLPVGAECQQIIAEIAV